MAVDIIIIVEGRGERIDKISLKSRRLWPPFVSFIKMSKP